MNNLKVSLICTVKNEEKSIRAFLDSLLYQTITPDEIIIVDGGSQDKTVDIINSYMNKDLKINLIVEPQANIAKGRNIAILNSKNSLIAVTDAGCQLNNDWLENIVRPFEDVTVDVVAGWYEPDARNDYERCFAELTFPKLEKVKNMGDNFLPSSRSIAFRKECWKKVEGYPEWLYTAEDTLFDIKLKKTRCKKVFVENAIVRWRVRPNLKSLAKQYFLYAKGDGEARLFLAIYSLYFLSYTCGIVLLIAGFLYPLAWLILICLVFLYLTALTIRVFLHTRLIKALYLSPISKVLIDLAKIGGYIVGLTERKN